MLVRHSSLYLLLLAACIATSASAQTTDLEEIRVSGNIDHALPAQSGDLISNDQQIAIFSLANNTATGLALADNLDAADLDAYQQADACGPDLFSVDIAASINSQIVQAADIFTDDGSLILDATSEGLPANSNIDALTRDPANCDLIVSFDGFVEVDGSVFTGGDLVRWNAASGFSLFSNLVSDQPVDALFLLANDNLLISFAETVDVLGTIAQPNDVLEVNPANEAMVTFNPVLLNSSWQSTNLDALSSIPILAGELVWSVASVEVSEGIGNVNLTVDRINSSDTAATVTYTTVGNTATSGSDFIAQSGSINFADGQTTANISITIEDDQELEGVEVFFVDLLNVTVGTASIGSPARVEVQIRDNEDLLFSDGFESN